MKNKETVPLPLNVKILYPSGIQYEQTQFTLHQPVWIEIPWKKEYFTNWQEITALEVSSGNPEIPEKRLSVKGLKYLRDELGVLRNVETIKSNNFSEEEVEKW